MLKFTRTLVVLFLIVFASNTQAQVDTAKVGDAFRSYITAQNEHDLATLDKLFNESPDFLLIYGGKEYWGNADAIEASEKVHKAALVIEPVYEKMRIISLTDQSAQVYVPALYNLKEGGKNVKRNLILNITFGLKGEEWKVFSIITMPATGK